MPAEATNDSCDVVQEAQDGTPSKVTIPLEPIATPNTPEDNREGCIDLISEDDNLGISDNADIETGVSENEHTPIAGSISSTPRNVVKSLPPSAAEQSDYEICRVIFAFSVCCLSSVVSHVIRIPLYTTKVELQNSMNFSTLDLTHLDNLFSVFHALGQMGSPFLSSTPHSVLMTTFHHIVMGLTISVLFVSNNFLQFSIVYAVAGFVSGPTWAILFAHLSAWLPKKYSFPMITLWFTCTDFGYIIGGLICMYVHLHWVWRLSYIVTGLLNVLVGVVLFCFHDECKEPLEDGRLIDPRAIIKRNIGTIVSFIHKLRWGDPKVSKFIENEGKESAPIIDSRREFILSGISNIKSRGRDEATSTAKWGFNNDAWFTYALSTYEKMLTSTRQYIFVIQRMSYLGRILTVSFILKMVKYFLSSWMSFYVCTVYNYSASRGSYVTFMLRLGNCIGNLGSAILCKAYWKDRPLTACLYFYGMSTVVVFSFCIIDFSSILVYSICCFLCGVVTTAAEAIMMAKGIKSLCDRSQLSQRESVSVYGFILSTTTVGSVAQGFLVAYVVDNYGWTTLFGIFVVALMGATGLLYKPSWAEHVQ